MNNVRTARREAVAMACHTVSVYSLQVINLFAGVDKVLPDSNQLLGTSLFFVCGVDSSM